MDFSDLTSGGSSNSNPFATLPSLLSVPLSTILTLNIHGQIPVTLHLNPPNFKLWRSFFHALFMSYGIYDHIDGTVDAKHRRHDVAWTQVEWCIVRWLYAMISEELQGMVPQDQPSAYTLWTAICSLFLDNRTQRGLIALEEFHGLRQEHLSVMEYFTRLQNLADTLRDCDMAVTDRGLVSNMLRGLSNKFSHAITTMTYDETKLPTFLQARSYLLQEERRIDRAAAHEPATALHAAARAPAAPTPAAAPPPAPAPPATGSSNSNGGQRGRKRRKGGNGGTAGYGAAPSHGGAGGSAPAFFPNTAPARRRSTRPPPRRSGAPRLHWPWRLDHSSWRLLGHVLPPDRPHVDAAALLWRWGLVLRHGGQLPHGRRPCMLSTSFPRSTHPGIIVGNGATMPVSHSGDALIPTSSSPLTLRNVLISPHLIKNLISVRAFTRDNFVAVSFDPFGFSVKDLISGTVLLRDVTAPGTCIHSATPPTSSSPMPCLPPSPLTCGISG